MARNFRELEAKMSPESQARVAARVKEELRNMPLHQLRNAREIIALEIEVMVERGEDLPSLDGDAAIRIERVVATPMLRQ